MTDTPYYPSLANDMISRHIRFQISVHTDISINKTRLTCHISSLNNLFSHVTPYKQNCQISHTHNYASSISDTTRMIQYCSTFHDWQVDQKIGSLSRR